VLEVVPQSFLFPIAEWRKATATAWLRSRGYRYNVVTKEANHYRAQQFSPDGCINYWTKVWYSRKDANMRGRRKPKKILAVYCHRRDR
jgi:hypothetical protein